MLRSQELEASYPRTTTCFIWIKCRAIQGHAIVNGLGVRTNVHRHVSYASAVTHLKLLEENGRRMSGLQMASDQGLTHLSHETGILNDMELTKIIMPRNDEALLRVSTNFMNQAHVANARGSQREPSVRVLTISKNAVANVTSRRQPCSKLHL